MQASNFLTAWLLVWGIDNSLKRLIVLNENSLNATHNSSWERLNGCKWSIRSSEFCRCTRFSHARAFRHRSKNAEANLGLSVASDLRPRTERCGLLPLYITLATIDIYVDNDAVMCHNAWHTPLVMHTSRKEHFQLRAKVYVQVDCCGSINYSWLITKFCCMFEFNWWKNKLIFSFCFFKIGAWTFRNYSSMAFPRFSV